MSNLLVTGASGQLGSAIVRYLLEAGGHAVIAASRDPAKLGVLAALGATTRRADFDDPASLVAAFAGVDRLLIVSTDSMESSRRVTQHLAAVAAAQAAGVGHILYTSMPNPETSAVAFAHVHKATEDAIKASGLPYTILRNAWYQENLLMALPHALASGQWFSAAGDGRTSHVARDDCARTAAAVLRDPPVNATLTVTGAQALTVTEIATLAAAATGKPIAVVPVDDAQLTAGYVQSGLPQSVADVFTSFDTATRRGDFDLVTDTVERFTGRAPQSLGDFLAAHKAALLG